MKRIAAIVLMLIATTAFAQGQLKSKMFTVQNRDPLTIASSLKLLGSGAPFAEISVNQELKTITVRDFPENIATIEEAIKRLDVPAPATPDVELNVSVLIGSKMPVLNAPVPEDLAPVVKQLESTLKYTHYGLMTRTVQRTKSGTGIEGSGVADAAALGMTASSSRPIIYTYRMRGITFDASAQRPSITTDSFNFSMRVPIAVNDKDIQYQSVGFETPVTVKEGEKVVIGTTTMKDKALIVVVTATVMR